MKSYLVFFFTLLFLISACSSGDSGKFAGTWQQTDDPSKQIIIHQFGKSFTFETRNIESSVQGTPGTYIDDEDALEFISNGDTITFVYDASTMHINALNKEFEKASDASSENKETAGSDSETAEASENSEDKDTPSNCEKGDILVISGNNVRLRAEPDVTKQNILMQFHKGYEVVRMDDTTVEGQKWYKVCYEGNIGWVSGQYASMK
jgi:hypothetical protein